MVTEGVAFMAVAFTTRRLPAALQILAIPRNRRGFALACQFFVSDSICQNKSVLF